MKNRILSPNEKRKVLKGELVKARDRASKSSDYITNAFEKLGELERKKSNLDAEILNKDIKFSYRADFTSYVGSFGIMSLSVSNLLSFIFQLDFLNSLFVNGLFCFVGMNMGFIALINKDLKKKTIKVLEKLSIKIENYLKSRQNYMSLINERDRVQKDISILESNKEKAMGELAILNKGIETLDFRLHCSEDRLYKVGKWATIVRREQPLTSKKKKRARQKIQAQI